MLGMVSEFRLSHCKAYVHRHRILQRSTSSRLNSSIRKYKISIPESVSTLRAGCVGGFLANSKTTFSIMSQPIGNYRYFSTSQILWKRTSTRRVFEVAITCNSNLILKRLRHLSLAELRLNMLGT